VAGGDILEIRTWPEMIPTPKILQALGWLLVVALIPFVLAILSVDLHVSDIKVSLLKRPFGHGIGLPMKATVDDVR
jgi:hypothetical protein